MLLGNPPRMNNVFYSNFEQRNSLNVDIKNTAKCSEPRRLVRTTPANQAGVPGFWEEGGRRLRLRLAHPERHDQTGDRGIPHPVGNAVPQSRPSAGLHLALPAPHRLLAERPNVFCNGRRPARPRELGPRSAGLRNRQEPSRNRPGSGFAAPVIRKNEREETRTPDIQSLQSRALYQLSYSAWTPPSDRSAGRQV